MCDERERLIGYIYDEVDTAERRLIEAHLKGCPDCRNEVAALQGTRQDLLAWAVPAHKPIWRPVPEPTASFSWRQIPAWGFAAAASALIASGVAGGLTARLLTPVTPPLAVAVASPELPAEPVQVASAADVAADVEARILARLRDELRQDVAAMVSSRVPQVPVAPVPARTARDEALAALTRRVVEMERWQDEQIRLNASLYSDISGVRSQARALDNRLMRVSLSAADAGFPR